MSDDVGKWVMVPGFDEALRQLVRDEMDALIQERGELRLQVDALYRELVALKKRVAELEAQQRISYTEPPEYVIP